MTTQVAQCHIHLSCHPLQLFLAWCMIGEIIAGIVLYITEGWSVELLTRVDCLILFVIIIPLGDFLRCGPLTLKIRKLKVRLTRSARIGIKRNKSLHVCKKIVIINLWPKKGPTYHGSWNGPTVKNLIMFEISNCTFGTDVAVCFEALGSGVWSNS